MSRLSIAGLCIFVAAWLPMLVAVLVEHTTGEPQTACGAAACILVGAPLGIGLWALGLLVAPSRLSDPRSDQRNGERAQ